MLCPDDCYGGTFRTLEHARRVHGLETTFLDLTDLEARGRRHPARHPAHLGRDPVQSRCCACSDLAALARVARERGLLLAVDNTFLSPVLQRPLRLRRRPGGPQHHQVPQRPQRRGGRRGGGGRGPARPGPAPRRPQQPLGTSQSPHDCALVLRGLKTLHLRMKAHEANALAVAQALAAAPGRGRG